jgi:hypothetical protein
MSMEPEAEGFRQVHSRRRGRRRVPPRSARPVPPNLVGLCFDCLACDHVKAACTFLSRCFNCRHEGHRARDHPLAPVAREGKRGPHCRIRSAVAVGCCGEGHHSSPVRTSWTTRRLPARPPSTLPAVPSLQVLVAESSAGRWSRSGAPCSAPPLPPWWRPVHSWLTSLGTPCLVSGARCQSRVLRLSFCREVMNGGA